MAQNYSIGQHTFSGHKDEYYSTKTDAHINSSGETELVVNEIFTNGGTGVVFQDLLLTGNKSFVKGFALQVGTPYVLDLKIPASDNYDMDFALKLVSAFPKEDSDISSKEYNVSENYQLIRYIKVPKNLAQEMESNRVCLYERPVEINNDKTVIEATIPKGVCFLKDISNALQKENSEERISNWEPNTLYIFPNNQNRYLYSYGNEKINIENVDTFFNDTAILHNQQVESISNKNDIILFHTWKNRIPGTEEGLYDVHFRIIFTPRALEVGFNSILLEMVRIPQDTDIKGEDNGTFGRYVDSSRISAKLAPLKNIVPAQSQILSHIGIWAEPEFQFSINGEDLKVGASGYYEINDFEIRNLGVAPRNDQDFFVVDYQSPIAD